MFNYNLDTQGGNNDLFDWSVPVWGGKGTKDVYQEQQIIWLHLHRISKSGVRLYFDKSKIFNFNKWKIFNQEILSALWE